MNRKTIYYSIIDAAREYVRIALAENSCYWSESLFSGDQAEQLSHVAPHLYGCDVEGIVAWLTLRDFGKGEAGILFESPLDFWSTRNEMKRRLTVYREINNRQAFFRFYDPRVLRTFLPACTPEELAEFYGPFESFHCQSEKHLHVMSYRLHPDNSLTIQERHIDQFMLDCNFVTQADMDQAKAELKSHA